MIKLKFILNQLPLRIDLIKITKCKCKNSWIIRLLSILRSWHNHKIWILQPLMKCLISLIEKLASCESFFRFWGALQVCVTPRTFAKSFMRICCWGHTRGASLMSYSTPDPFTPKFQRLLAIKSTNDWPAIDSGWLLANWTFNYGQHNALEWQVTFNLTCNFIAANKNENFMCMYACLCVWVCVCMCCRVMSNSNTYILLFYYLLFYNFFYP